MASYLEQYQYDQVQPANTNVEQIAKSFQTKMAYWQQGASQVKNAYQNYLGLSLTNSTNKQQLEDYMKSAKEEILKASNADLSIGENVTNTLGVFDNLTNGKSAYSQNILGDHQLTTHYAAQEEAIKNAKTKDKGVGYNAANEQYMRQAYNEFAQDQDPNNWKQHAQNKKSYESYYDYQSEFKKILDDCTANKTSSVSEVPNSLLFQEVSDNSLTSAKLNGCISSGLSSKAQRQIQIESVVKYNKDYSALGRAYQNQLNNHAKALSISQQEDQVKLTYYSNLKNPTEGDKEAQKYYSERVASYGSEFQKLNDSLSKIKENDFSFIEKNYEAVAGQVGIMETEYNFSQAFSNINTSNKVSPNQARMLEYRENAQNNRLEYSTNADIEAAKTAFENEKELATTKYSRDFTIAQLQAISKNGGKFTLDENGQMVLAKTAITPEAEPLTDEMIKNNAKVEFENQVNKHFNELQKTEIEFSSNLLKEPTVRQSITNGTSIKIPDWKDQRGKIHKGLELLTRNEEEKQKALEYFEQNPAVFASLPFYQNLRKQALGENSDKFNATYGNLLKDFATKYTEANLKVESDKALKLFAENELQSKGWNRQEIEKQKEEVVKKFNFNNSVSVYEYSKDPHLEYPINLKITKDDLKNLVEVSKEKARSFPMETRDSRIYQLKKNGRTYTFIDRGFRDHSLVNSGNPKGGLVEYLDNLHKIEERFKKDENDIYASSNYERTLKSNITTLAKSQVSGEFRTLFDLMGVDAKGQFKKFDIKKISTSNRGDAEVQFDADPKLFKEENLKGLETNINSSIRGAEIQKVEGFPNRYKIVFPEKTLKSDIVNIKDETQSLRVFDNLFTVISKTKKAITAPDYTKIHEQQYVGLNGKPYAIVMSKTSDGFLYEIAKYDNGKKELIPGYKFTSPTDAMVSLSALGSIDNNSKKITYTPQQIDASNYTKEETVDNSTEEKTTE